MPKNKPRAIYLIITVISVLLASYATIFVIGKYYINAKKIKKVLIEKIESKLDRKVSLDDDLGFSLSWDMSPRIQINKLSISNSTSRSQPIMLSADTLTVKFNLLYLLFKELHITKLELIKPILYLESAHNKNNWTFASADENHDTSGNFHVGEIMVVDGTVYYAENNKKPVKISLKKFNFSSNNSSTFFDMSVDGIYDAIPIIAAVSADLGNHQVNIKLNKLQSGKSNLNGKLLIKNNYKNIYGEFNSTLLRSSDLPTSPSNSSASGEYNSPHLELPIELLKDTEIDMALNIKALELGKLSLSHVTLNISSKDNILNIGFEPDLNIATGKLSANLSYNIKNSSPTLSLIIESTDLKLESLLNMLMDKSPIVGSNLILKTNLYSNGTKINELVKNLTGRILATVSPGKYVNSDTLLTTMITFDKRQSYTELKCGVMNFNVHGGIATAHNGIGIEAAGVNVLGNGKIDLHNGRINFSIKPHNTSKSPIDLAQFSLAQLVEISGTLRNPTVSLNPVGLLAPDGAIAKTLVGKLVGGIPGSIANVAKDMLGEETEASNISPCKTALGS